MEKKDENVVEKSFDLAGDNYLNAQNSLKRILLNNFLGGIAWALGISIGASLVLAIIGFIFGKINLIPMVGNFIIEVNKFIQENSSTFNQ